MEQIKLQFKRLSLVLGYLIMTIVTFAQDKKIEVDINSNGSNWYAQPWVWLVGAAVFILLLVALTRSGSRSDA